MKVFIVCSKAFYAQVTAVQSALEQAGHKITLPNSFDNPNREAELKLQGAKEHAAWKAEMIREQNQKIKANDAILVLNYDKAGQANYIGGATFLEMFKAFELGRKIFLMNPVPESILTDEIKGFAPTVIQGDLSQVK